MKTLKIADGLALPLDAATQTFAFIARKGAGKTYAAGKLVELFLDAGVQVVVLDTVGNWYGLRLGADGKTGGFDVPVLGGLRGDIPLEAAGGALIADIVVETGRSLVVDVSQFSLSDRKRFATTFGERLWLRKKGETHPAPLHLVIEESQLIVPQFSGRGGDDARMLGVFEEIIRLGRNYGIGVSMITQRPQSVNKEVLNQTECLFVGQVNGAQERDALKKWITHQGMDVHLVDELPGLKIGTFYVWSPQWLNLLERVQILPKNTFDASATPKVGDKRVQRELKPLDLSELQQKMSATIERKKADDPRELRKRIATLETELKSAAQKAAKTSVDGHSGTKSKVEVLTDADRELLKTVREELQVFSENIVAKADVTLKSLADRAKASIDDALKVWTVDVDKRRELFVKRLSGTRVQKILDKLDRVATAPTPAVHRHTTAAPRTTQRPSPAAPPAGTFQRTPATGAGDNGHLPGVQQKILNALAELEQLGLTPVDRVQLALMAGYTNARSGGFSEPLGQLITGQLVTVPNPGLVSLTAEGRTGAVIADAPRSVEELQDRIIGVLSGPEQKLLRLILDVYPHVITREELAQRAGYGNHRSGGFSEPLGRLATLKLVRALRGTVSAAPQLFLEAP